MSKTKVRDPDNEAEGFRQTRMNQNI